MRGATRLARYLHRLAELGLEKVEEGEGIFRSEWDTLIVLDACRHDLYEEVNGDTEYRISLGSCTKDFLRKNFTDKELDDVVYISGNPHLNNQLFPSLTGKTADEVFFETYHTYQTDWDNEKGTVRGAPIVRDYNNAEKLFPDKKKIVHFMQPHHPFLEHEFNVNLEVEGVDFEVAAEAEERKRNVWTLAQRKKLEIEEVLEGYRKNLEYVMPYVQEIVDSTEGRVIVTSDHGNLLGENGLYGHPCGSNVKCLRKVPWEVMQ